MEEGKKFRLTIQLFHCRKVSERFQDMASSSPLNLLPHLLVLLFFIHESQSCPQPMEFHCPDNAYKGIPTLDLPFTNKYMPECGRLCELTCENNISTTINCTGHPMAVLPVSHVFLNNRTIIVDLDHLKIRGPCDAVLRGVSNASFPSSPLVSFTIVGAFETLVKCPKERYPRGVNNHNNICPNKHYIVYAPMEDGPGQYPENHPPGCSSIQVPRLLPDQKGFYIQYNISDGCQGCHRKGGQCYDNSDGKPDCDMGPSSTEESKKGRLRLTLGIAIPSVGILGLITICFFLRRKKPAEYSIFGKRNARLNLNVEAFLKSYGSLAPKRYTYSDIKKITCSFKEKVGQGGYGVVYKGRLVDGHVVAVKLLKQSKGDGEEFINEVASIGRTNHVNIVSLLGFCSEGKKRALVYEFMVNGSLEKFTKDGANHDQSLTLKTLFGISLGIARGLEYLHRGCQTRILHFDIKPHNILLDENFCPKISDFGLAKLYPQDKQSRISMSVARGTVGYIAPEVFCRNFGDVSHKSDVYSYGMMVLEVIGSRRRTTVSVETSSSDMYFPNWIYKQLDHGEEEDGDGLMNNEEKELKRKLIVVSLWCIQTVPSSRPSMSRVVQMLEASVETIEIPPMPSLSSPPRSQADPSGTSTMTL